MKTSINAFLISLFVLLIYSCSESPSNTEVNNTFDLTSQLTIIDGSNTFTKTFYDLGAQSVSVSQNKKQTKIDFLVPNATIIGKDFKKESNLVFTIEDEVLYIAGDKTNGVTLRNKSPYILTTEFEGYSSKMTESDFNEKIGLLLLTLDEITASQSSKKKAKEACKSKVSTCSGTVWYMSSIAWSRSVVESNVESEEAAAIVAEHEEESGESCSKIGGPDSSCFFGNHACYGTQAYCCQ